MQKAINVKAEIMEVAEKLFIKFGFDKISIDRIAKESKHAKGSVYYHFAGKQDLINSIIQKEEDTLRENLLKVINSNKLSGLDKIRTYILVRMQSMNKSFTYHKALKEKIITTADSNAIKCYSDIHDSFVTWEKEQLTALIVSSKNNGLVSKDINVTKFVNMLLMILTSLECPFFIFGKYEDYTSTFNNMIDDIIIKALK